MFRCNGGDELIECFAARRDAARSSNTSVTGKERAASDEMDSLTWVPYRVLVEALDGDRQVEVAAGDAGNMIRVRMGTVLSSVLQIAARSKGLTAILDPPYDCSLP